MTTVSRELALWSPGYVYLWIDMSNGMMYVGSHNGKDPAYIGSGTWFKSAFRKRPLQFCRIILYTGTDFRVIEQVYLDVVDAANNPLYYNLSNIADRVDGYSWSLSELTRLRQSRAATLRWLDPEIRAKTIAASSARFRDTEFRAKHRASTQFSNTTDKSLLANHIRWHVNRGISSSECDLC